MAYQEITIVDISRVSTDYGGVSAATDVNGNGRRRHRGYLAGLDELWPKWPDQLVTDEGGSMHATKVRRSPRVPSPFGCSHSQYAKSLRR